MRAAPLSAVVATFVAGLGLCGTASAQHEAELDVANTNIKSQQSLQEGAKYFVNYCLGCHSAQYVRYNRLAEDLGLTEQQLVDNLMFTGERPFDTMSIAMRPEDATRWFGNDPPDLSLVARSRGKDWLYTFLRGFYVDPARPTGANNIVLPNAAMPPVLWELQGLQRAKFSIDAEHGGEQVFDGFETIQPGTMTAEEFDNAMLHLVNFLDYIGEPIKREREALGIRVIGFLLVFLLIAYMLKKEIWKDVH
jgi:ubiquinol-cytochrome c reductase cytochrome c1 subunit